MGVVEVEECVFLYSFVARGKMVLAEYEQKGNFGLIAGQSLQKLTSSDNNFTYQYENHVFYFLVEDGYAYCVVAKESVRKQISITLLQRIKADFMKRYRGRKADTAAAKSLNKDFGPLMKEQMRYVSEHGDEILDYNYKKLVAVQAQVSQVKNITDAIGRGEALTVLNDKADVLRESAQEFKTRGAQILRKMWYQNMKIKLLVLGILLLLALILCLSICRGFHCTN